MFYIIGSFFMIWLAWSISVVLEDKQRKLNPIQTGRISVSGKDYAKVPISFHPSSSIACFENYNSTTCSTMIDSLTSAIIEENKRYYLLVCWNVSGNQTILWKIFD